MCLGAQVRHDVYFGESGFLLILVNAVCLGERSFCWLVGWLNDAYCVFGKARLVGLACWYYLGFVEGFRVLVEGLRAFV